MIKAKHKHEFRDPVHGFIELTSSERNVVDSKPFQRLRHIHQLATTFLLYPGATHRRFEHSFGVMELATRIFNTLTSEENLSAIPQGVRNALSELSESNRHLRETWKTTLRMAALCHDLGHVPFSHAGEGLLPPGYTHERMTWDIIVSPIMAEYWNGLKINARDVAKLAVGAKDASKFENNIVYSPLESILSEIIVGDNFGADRMDYLLRDSYHIGADYGHFDHKRLIQSLRISAKVPEGDGEKGVSNEPTIGIERGGLHAAASLPFARHSMFSQVYLHHIRRVYDIHLQDFIKAIYPQGLPIKLDKFLEITDNDILVKLKKASNSKNSNGHDAANRIKSRKHFRLVYQETRAERMKNPDALQLVFDALSEKFGSDNIKKDSYSKKSPDNNFPVILNNFREIAPAGVELQVQAPESVARYIFAEPSIYSKANSFVHSNKAHSIKSFLEE